SQGEDPPASIGGILLKRRSAATEETGMRRIVLLLPLLALAVGLAAAALARATAATTTLYVAPAGANSNPGTQARPLRTIQSALNRARPGTKIVLAPGAYHEALHTVVSGTAAAPIVIQGPETGMDPTKRHVATLYGTWRILTVDSSYLTLRGFTIDGEEGL